LPQRPSAPMPHSPLTTHYSLQSKGVKDLRARVLATALLLKQQLNRIRRPDLTFLSADERLCQIATLEGLTVENPNLHL